MGLGNDSTVNVGMQRNIVPLPTYGAPDDALPRTGKGHPLLAGKLVQLGAIRWPVLPSNMGVIKDEHGTPYLISIDGYQLLNFLIAPDHPPTGRNDPVLVAWYNEANGRARQIYRETNQAIYEKNGWNNADFVTSEPMDRTVPKFGPSDPYMIVARTGNWTRYGALELHNPPDDGRDQVNLVRSRFSLDLVKVVIDLYGSNLQTLDGYDPSWYLMVNRWTRVAYISGSNILTAPRALSYARQISGSLIAQTIGSAGKSTDFASLLLNFLTLGITTATKITGLDRELAQSEGLLRQEAQREADKTIGGSFVGDRPLEEPGQPAAGPSLLPWLVGAAVVGLLVFG